MLCHTKPALREMSGGAAYSCREEGTRRRRLEGWRREPKGAGGVAKRALRLETKRRVGLKGGGDLVKNC
jgi:hypothetical protein